MDEVLVPGAKALPTSALRSEPLFLWYDYFSCPQMHNEALFSDRVTNLHSQLSKAVDSIPAYLGKCSFFFALCPTLENTAKSGLISATSWADRGWCCAERAFRELSDDPRWIMVKSGTDLEVVLSPSESLGKMPGEGSFSVPSDKAKLEPLLVAAVLKRKLLRLVMAQDFVGYRVFLNLQAIYLRGYPAAPTTLHEPVPDFKTDSDLTVELGCLSVAKFLHQNGFRTIRETDGAGWSALHYAALRGDPALLKVLLKLRADHNQLTKKGQWRLGLSPGTSALAISLLFKHNDVSDALKPIWTQAPSIHRCMLQ